MPTAMRSPTGLAIGALLILLSPATGAAQSHRGLVSISAVSTLGALKCASGMRSSTA